MKYTTETSKDKIAELLAKYKSGTLTNDEKSQMSPALRKHIERQANK